MAYTTDYRLAEPRVGAPPINSISTVQQLPLGTILKAFDVGANANGEGEFQYVKGVASGARGAWAVVNQDDYSTTLLVADAKGPVGVMMAALVASTYGFVQISGKAVGKALAGYVDNALVYGTSTAGSVDDAVVSGDRVKEALGASALDGPETGMAEFEINRPYVDDGSAA